MATFTVPLISTDTLNVTDEYSTSPETTATAVKSTSPAIIATTATPTADDDPPPIGVIVGCAVAGVVCIALVVLVIYCCCCRRREEEDTMATRAMRSIKTRIQSKPKPPDSELQLPSVTELNPTVAMAAATNPVSIPRNNEPKHPGQPSHPSQPVPPEIKSTSTGLYQNLRKTGDKEPKKPKSGQNPTTVPKVPGSADKIYVNQGQIHDPQPVKDSLVPPIPGFSHPAADLPPPPKPHTPTTSGGYVNSNVISKSYNDLHTSEAAALAPMTSRSTSYLNGAMSLADENADSNSLQDLPSFDAPGLPPLSHASDDFMAPVSAPGKSKSNKDYMNQKVIDEHERGQPKNARGQPNNARGQPNNARGQPNNGGELRENHYQDMRGGKRR